MAYTSRAKIKCVWVDSCTTRDTEYAEAQPWDERGLSSPYLSRAHQVYEESTFLPEAASIVHAKKAFLVILKSSKS